MFIIFMYILCLICCPQYIIIGLLVSAVLEDDADRFFKLDCSTLYNTFMSVIKSVTLWPAIILYYTQKRIKENA